MIPFDPENPFPLLPEDEHSYGAEQAHSAIVDEWLGLHTELQEAKLKQQKKDPLEQRWIGLPTQALLTPYTELRRILQQLSLPEKFLLVDLGAAYGRLGFVMARHYPEAHFLGFELEPLRVEEGQKALAKHYCENATLEECDLTSDDFLMPRADAYFIYDFGTRAAIEKSLHDLRELAREQSVLVVARGRAVRDAIEKRHPWLTVIEPPQHFYHYSIYRS